MEDVRFDLDTIPDSLTLPHGIYLVRPEEVEPKFSNNGILYLQVPAKIVEGEYAGRNVFMKFFLGTKDDPHAEDPATTRKPGWTRLKQFWAASKANTRSGGAVAVTRSAVGNTLKVKVTEKTSEQTGNKYNEVTDYYASDAVIPGPGMGAFAAGGVVGGDLGFNPTPKAPCPMADCDAQLTPSEFSNHLKENHTN